MLSTGTTTRENLLLLLSVAAAVALSSTEAFGPLHVPGGQLQHSHTRSRSSTPFISSNSKSSSSLFSSLDFTPSFDDEEEDDDEDDEEDDDEDDEIRIDPDSLGDWRTFRRNLAATPETAEEIVTSVEGTTTEETTTVRMEQPNEKVLKAQSEELAKEYTGVWAHETSTVSIYIHWFIVLPYNVLY
jgi:hypothetical protein